jgi:drug/metabolite transporter (DMT)-like permease
MLLCLAVFGNVSITAEGFQVIENDPLGAQEEMSLLQSRTSTESVVVEVAEDTNQARSDWPVGNFQVSFATMSSFKGGSIEQKVRGGACILGLMVVLILAQRYFIPMNVLKVACLGLIYVCVSACMIESNKWLMREGHFPYPMTLTMNHMTMSLVLANLLRLVRPSAFPAMRDLEVTPWFCMKFLPIGAAFALSIVCGNGAYQYLSVSFLQIMKQCNVVLIYTLSVICGLEALRRCSVVLLLFTLCGTLLAVHGELHFQLIGFVLQVVSSLTEASKVIIQSLLMSGSSRLDPMTMVLFMAPACLLANVIPFAILEGPHIAEIAVQFKLFLPFILVNASMAFLLNLLVATCIKELSAVGYLLCGIVKDVTIIVSSAWFLGESLAPQQVVGFSVALSGVALYSLYKQNKDCFEEDLLLPGFAKVAQRLFGVPETIGAKAQSAVPPSEKTKLIEEKSP